MAAHGEPAVRDGAARERGRRRSAYEAPNGSVARGPVSSGAESKRRRCPRSRARQSRVTLLGRRSAPRPQPAQVQAAQARSHSSRTFVTPRNMKRRRAIACLLAACRRITCGTRAGPNSAAGRRGRRRSAYEAPRAAADGGTRLRGAESKRRRRPRLPAPPSRVTLLDPRRRAHEPGVVRAQPTGRHGLPAPRRAGWARRVATAARRGRGAGVAATPAGSARACGPRGDAAASEARVNRGSGAETPAPRPRRDYTRGPDYTRGATTPATRG